MGTYIELIALFEVLLSSHSLDKVIDVILHRLRIVRDK